LITEKLDSYGIDTSVLGRNDDYFLCCFVTLLSTKNLALDSNNEVAWTYKLITWSTPRSLSQTRLAFNCSFRAGKYQKKVQLALQSSEMAKNKKTALQSSNL